MLRLFLSRLKPIISFIYRSNKIGPISVLGKSFPFFKRHITTFGTISIICLVAFFNLFWGAFEKGDFIFGANLGDNQGGPEVFEEVVEPGQANAISLVTQSQDISFVNQDSSPTEDAYYGDDFLGYLVVGDDSLVSSLGPDVAYGLRSDRTRVITYTVRGGDTLSEVADSFGISVNTLIWANRSKDGVYLKPGDELIILPVSGVKHEVKGGDTVASIAVKYKADASQIITFNHLTADGNLTEGDVLIVPNGQALDYVPKSVPPRYVAALPNLDNYFIFPTTGYNWGKWHPVNAVDIANQCGTPIYAAAAGIVTKAVNVGWRGSQPAYGKNIWIDHPNGVSTVYGHLDELLVGEGTYVVQGQPIALMGNTGRTHGPTGCHLHFEVRGAKNSFVRY